MIVSDSDFKTFKRCQKTLRRKVTTTGIGIHTGAEVSMTIAPALPDTGVVFQRTDLPGMPKIPALQEYVLSTNRCTTLGLQNAFISTVEHVLAALKAYEIDNALVQVSAQEIPIGDGSSSEFVRMIEEGGIAEQDETVDIIKLEKPVHWSSGGQYLIALPHEGLRISYSLHYPHIQLLQNQFHSVLLTSEIFKNEIAPCRTFAFYEEVQPLMDSGLIKGGSLENTVVIRDEAVLNPEGPRFKNEMARHKLLDLIGDFSLSGLNLHAHILGYRTGHDANIQFVKKLCGSINTEKLTCQTM